jgi:hypothetical protein
LPNCQKTKKYYYEVDLITEETVRDEEGEGKVNFAKIEFGEFNKRCIYVCRSHKDKEIKKYIQTIN